MPELRMPSLGADMDAGSVTEWRVHPGDVVHRGDIVAVVETDKADIEIETFEDGVIEALMVAEGERVPVGTVLATLTSPDGRVAETPPEAAARSAQVPSGNGAAHPNRTRSPLVRRLADDLGIDLDEVPGTGPGGTVTRHDVERAGGPAPAPPPAPVVAPQGTPASVTPPPRTAGDRTLATPRARALAATRGLDLRTLTGTGLGGAVTGADVEGAPAPAVTSRRAVDPAAAMRAAIAGLVERSNREIPHYYVESPIDVRAMTAWLAEVNEDRPPSERILPAAVLLRAVAGAAATTPAVNGWWLDGTFVPGERVDLGVVVSLRTGGLLVPVIRDASSLTVEETMAELRAAVMRARAGRLRASELTDPSISVTNLGDLGAQRVDGVIYPPQVAIVGFGRIAEEPWVHEGTVEVRPVVHATVAADHRASDGAAGARFLTTLARLLTHPEDL